MTKSIVVLLDSSSSMCSLGDEPLDALNEIIRDQKKMKIKGSLFSYWTFSEKVQLIVNDIPLENIEEIKKYDRGGATALNDAIGMAIQQKTNSEDNKDITLFIITDGHENSSQMFSQKDIKELTEDVQKNYNWKIVFIGANQDSQKTGASLGIKSCCNFLPIPGDLCRISRSVSEQVANYRSRGTNIVMPVTSQQMSEPVTPTIKSEQPILPSGPPMVRRQ